MGCSGDKTLSSHQSTRLPHFNKWRSNELLIKEIILSFISERNIDVNLCFSTRIVYYKKYKHSTVYKDKLRLFSFIPRNATRPGLVENQLSDLLNFMKNFIEKYPQYKQHYDSNSLSFLKTNNKHLQKKKLKCSITPGLIFSHDYSALFSNITINWNEKRYVVLHFISFKHDHQQELTKLRTTKSIEQMQQSNHYASYSIIFSNDSNAYSLKEINDFKEKKDYANLIGYSIVFYKAKVKYWFKSTVINHSLMNNIIKRKKAQVDSKAIVKEYISKSLNDESLQYELRYESYDIYNSNHCIDSSEVFPIIFKSSSLIKLEEKQSLIFNMIIKEKEDTSAAVRLRNEIEVIVNDSQCLISIEVFKEKKYSLLSRGVFNNQINYNVILSKATKNLKDVRTHIDNVIHPSLNEEDNNTHVRWLIIHPRIGQRVTLPFQSEAKAKSARWFVILYYNNYLDTIHDDIISKYNTIFNQVIDVIVLITENDINSITPNDNSQYHFVNIDNIDITQLDCFFIPLNMRNNYNSHFLLLLNENNQVAYCDFFKNTSSIYFSHLKTFVKGETNLSRLPLIKKDSFKRVKQAYKTIISQYTQSKLKEPSSPLILSDKNCYDYYYHQGIFYQPLLSFKYNKLIESSSVEKAYKNYTINLTFNNDLINIQELNQPINELSKCFITSDTDFSLGMISYFKCKECNRQISGKVTNNGIDDFKQISFYLCPITKDIYCPQCEQLKDKLSYPFNLLFVKCKERQCLLHLPNNNLDYFQKRYDILKAPEIKENNCDLCASNLFAVLAPVKNTFYVLLNFTNRNLPFLICESCFQLLKKDELDWKYSFQFDYIKRYCFNNYIDLNNLICKKIDLSK